ncbi:unnamed protein product [Cylindrotheca closterium]|uniref:Orc1-like AAA ATPase domain-containing protein n=1 Tax=Cylindrotheca closterium TaxID=2856 RepID=A0AAD2FQ89_9STRA|nr:unnamed protein product [Cylindrotheca closterium]
MQLLDEYSSIYQDSTDSSLSRKPDVSVSTATNSVYSLSLSQHSTGLAVEGSTSVVGNGLKASELRKTKVGMPRKSLSLQTSAETLNQGLGFESMPLVGRGKEVSQLKHCFDRMLQQIPEDSQSSLESKKELVLVKGESGAGKSAVAMTLEKEVLEHADGIFVQGKFDMNTSSKPYSGICKAFGALCQKIMDSPAEAVCTVQAAIHEQVGNDADLLVHLVPELKGLLTDPVNDPAVTNVGADAVQGGLERVRFSLRVLMRIFSSTFSPLVIFLDDLQWADVSSLQVLEFLLSDTQNDNRLMIIGCYRSDEVDENSLLHNKIAALQEMTTKYNFCVTEVSVGAFGLNEIEQVVSTLLPNPNVSARLGLAKICLKRTLGNPFFVLEFLKMLHQEGLVQRHTDASKAFTWNVDKVDNETMATANVTVMLHNQLTKLPQQVQALLQCAAYLGSTFTESTIDLVWTAYGRRLVETKLERTVALLEIIVKEEVLEKYANSKYRWVHDKLQEAALSLTGKQRESFQLDIGRTLYYGLNRKQVEEELFSVVDLINNGNVLQLTEFASANLRAAEKARDLSAYQSAAEYAAHGIALLEDDKWSSDRLLTLKLYTMGAEMEAMLGNVDATNRYTEEVLAQGDFEQLEIVPLKMAKANMLHHDFKFDESVNFCMQILRDLGCKVAWARRLVPVQAIVTLMRLSKRAKALPQSFYDKLVPIKDPRQMAIASVFSKLVTYSFFKGDMLLYTLLNCRLLEMTLNHGINEFSAKSFASIAGTLIIANEDYETATTFNNIALSMIKKFRGMHASETTYLACGPGLAWVIPFEEIQVTLRSAVAEGLREGDSMAAMWNLLTSHVDLPYAMGRPLAVLLKEISAVCIQCENEKVPLNGVAAETMRQMILKLRGASGSNPIELECDMFGLSKEEETNSVNLGFIHFAQTELALFNGNDYESAAKRALKVGDEYSKLIPAYPMFMVELFHRAVPLFAAARLTKKRQYKVEARRLLKRINKWIKAGNANVQYYFLFLTAENLVLDKKYDAADEMYNDALAKVTAKGHLNHLGLINERYADFLIEARSSEARGKEHLNKAIQYYKEWGAESKAKMVEFRLSTLK